MVPRLFTPLLTAALVVEHHESLLQPSWDLKVADEDLERDRKYRVRE